MCLRGFPRRKDRRKPIPLPESQVQIHHYEKPQNAKIGSMTLSLRRTVDKTCISHVFQKIATVLFRMIEKSSAITLSLAHFSRPPSYLSARLDSSVSFFLERLKIFSGHNNSTEPSAIVVRVLRIYFLEMCKRHTACIPSVRNIVNYLTTFSFNQAETDTVACGYSVGAS